MGIGSLNYDVSKGAASEYHFIVFVFSLFFLFLYFVLSQSLYLCG